MRLASLFVVLATATFANAERLQPEADELEGCTLPVERDKLVRIPDEIELRLSPRDRLEIGRAIKADVVNLHGGAEARRVAKAFDVWLRAGAKMHVRQAVAVPFDLARGPDRIAVVEFEVREEPEIAVVAAPSKRWVSLIAALPYDVSSRLVAMANIDDDAWIELLFLDTANKKRTPWWLTGQDRVERDKRWRHVELQPGGRSISSCP